MLYSYNISDRDLLILSCNAGNSYCDVAIVSSMLAYAV